MAGRWTESIGIDKDSPTAEDEEYIACRRSRHIPRCVADIGKLTRHEDGDGGGARATRGPWSRTRSSQAPLWISILRSSRVSKGEGKERVGIVCVVCMAWGGDKDEGE